MIASVAPCRGGPSEAVLAMARSQTRLGMEVEVVTTNDNGAGTLEVETGAFVDHRGARVWFMPRWSPPVGALREFQYAAAFSPWLEARIHQYDCLHVHGVFSYLPTRAMQIARGHGRRYIARPLGQLHQWSLQQSALKKKLYLALTERANLSGASVIHCTSQAEAEQVEALFPTAETAVIPHGVEPSSPVADASARLRETYGIESGVPVILFLSRWHRKKNIGLLIEALSRIKEMSWALVLAGATDDVALATEVKLQCERSGLTDRVICPGHVIGISKDVLLQGASLFVLPSASENFGIAVAEALVSGLPVVITPGVDLADTVLNLKGGLVCDENADSLAASLRAILGDVEWSGAGKRDELRAAARAVFSWDANARALASVYAGVNS